MAETKKMARTITQIKEMPATNSSDGNSAIKERMREFEELVSNFEEGKAYWIECEEDESTRGLALKLSRAAKRIATYTGIPFKIHTQGGRNKEGHEGVAVIRIPNKTK